MRKPLFLVPLLFLALSSFAPLIGCETTTGPNDPPRTCCRVCTTGKPCGDTCIARNLTCRSGRGCACGG